MSIYLWSRIFNLKPPLFRRLRHSWEWWLPQETKCISRSREVVWWHIVVKVCSRLLEGITCCCLEESVGIDNRLTMAEVVWRFLSSYLTVTKIFFIVSWIGFCIAAADAAKHFSILFSSNHDHFFGIIHLHWQHQCKTDLSLKRNVEEPFYFL